MLKHAGGNAVKIRAGISSCQKLHLEKQTKTKQPNKQKTPKKPKLILESEIHFLKTVFEIKCADKVLFYSMWFCWWLISYWVTYSGCILLQFLNELFSTVWQRLQVEVYDFQGTQAIDAKKVAYKIEVFKMGSCKAMRPIYQTINLVFQ